MYNVTYHVMGFLRQGFKDRYPPAIIEERLNGSTVNRYTGYDHGTYFRLYPMKGGKLVASPVPYERKSIGIKEAKRDF